MQQNQVKQLRLALAAAIESAGHLVCGPTDSRASENGEPVWVCNARAVLAETAEKGDSSVVVMNGIKNKWKRFAIGQVLSSHGDEVDPAALYDQLRDKPRPSDLVA